MDKIDYFNHMETARKAYKKYNNLHFLYSEFGEHDFDAKLFVEKAIFINNYIKHKSEKNFYVIVDWVKSNDDIFVYPLAYYDEQTVPFDVEKLEKINKINNFWRFFKKLDYNVNSHIFYKEKNKSLSNKNIKMGPFKNTFTNLQIIDVSNLALCV